MTKYKISFVLLTVLAVLLVNVSSTMAHVVVKPSQVGVGERLNFVVSVPTEENSPTVQVRLVIPDNVASVRPNVKPGWRIELKKTGEGEEAKVTEIIWSGGNIPAEQRDEFVFSAQAPAEETTLAWKAYQSYASGDVVSWDTDPKTVTDHETNHPQQDGMDLNMAPKPYSQTKVVNDLVVSGGNSTHSSVVGSENKEDKDKVALILSVLSLAMSGFALYKINSRKRA